MKGYASLILEGDLGELSKQIKDAIGRIYDSSTTLTNIVDDYLNISRIELGTMKYVFETIDLRGLVENVVGELKPNIEKSKLAFSFDADPQKKYMVTVDKDKFKQIIANLIDNSMKYTPSGSVKVSLEKKTDAEGRKIVFSVKDTGIGIAEGVMPKLFAKFSRAENGTRQNIHGTGLGLFVAKEIVMAHKGKIWAESPGEGKGSAFYVELEEVI
jgi:signal transduction histidine kinase